MKFQIRASVLVLVLIVLSFQALQKSLFAQTTPFQASWQEAGLPSVRNFKPAEYGAHDQNWAITQDLRGVLYIGNTSGVLEYDGVSWRLIKTRNDRRVKSFAIDKNGRIYVGAEGDFGYLAPDSLGALQYVSLVEHCPSQDRQFSDVWSVMVTTEGVYF